MSRVRTSPTIPVGGSKIVLIEEFPLQRARRATCLGTPRTGQFESPTGVLGLLLTQDDSTPRNQACTPGGLCVYSCEKTYHEPRNIVRHGQRPSIPVVIFVHWQRQNVHSQRQVMIVCTTVAQQYTHDKDATYNARAHPFFSAARDGTSTTAVGASAAATTGGAARDGAARRRRSGRPPWRRRALQGTALRRRRLGRPPWR